MEEAGKPTRVFRLSASKPNRLKWTPQRSIIRSESTSSNKYVFLHKWWLVKVNGKGLAVGGFTRRDERVSLFRSAAIARRHDATTVETADGMTVTLGGLIDQLRTDENGFPNEVCRRFMLGFPLDWEKCTDYDSGENSARTSTPDKHKLQSDGFQNDITSLCLDDVPAARIRDLTFGLGDGDNYLLMKNIHDDMLKKLGRTTQGSPAGCVTSAEAEIQVSGGVPAEPRTDHGSSTRVQQSGKDEEERPGAVDKIQVESSNRKSKAAAAAAAASTGGMTRGVSTRSMTIRKSLRNRMTRSMTKRMSLRTHESHSPLCRS